MKKRAFVRYSDKGKIVPGSLILTGGSFPQGSSKWNEVPADLCCDVPVTLSTSKKRAFVRYTKDGKIVPGSLIITNGSYPNGPAIWKEVSTNLCCNSSNVNCNSFWINQIVNPEGPNNLYVIGSGMDSKCNSFVVMDNYIINPNNPNTKSGQSFLLQKYSDTGNLIWEKAFDYEEDSNLFDYMSVQTISVDNEDNVLVFLVGAINLSGERITCITKFDNNGVQLWSIQIPNDKSILSITQCYVNKVVYDKFNNIYISLSISLDQGEPITGVQKISSSGTLLVTKFIEFDGDCNDSYINVNSAGELYLAAKSISLALYVIKFDASFNIIWNKKYDDTLGNIPYGVVFDKDENVIIQYGYGASTNGSGNEINGIYFKISPAGDILWTTRITNVNDSDFALGTYQMDSDANGDVYISSVYPATIPGYEGIANNTIIIGKISTAGIFEWAYAIEATNIIYTWWYRSPIAGKLVNNSLVLGYYSNEDSFNSQLFKLPLTIIPNGVYGDYTITNITNLWEKSSPEFILGDGTATVTTGETTTDALTYTTFNLTTPTSITKTILP